MNEVLPYFARRLRQLREAAGLSQIELARKVGFTKQSLSQLESGTRGPGWVTVQLLALALGTDCRTFADPALMLPPPRPVKRRGRPRKAAAQE